VDPQPIAIRFVLDIDPSSVDLEFMLKYEAAFGDERAEDSADDSAIQSKSPIKNAHSKK
jgi:hypothetical protein